MSHGLPPNPMRASSPHRDGPGPVEDRSPYPKAGYAALPRNADYPPPADDYDRSRGRWEGRRDSMDSRWGGREDWDRRPPPPRWEDEYGGNGSGYNEEVLTTDRPKRRRSPSPLGPSHRQRVHSPSPPRFAAPPVMPDPAELPHSLTFRQFADWFRASHPSTAKQDDDELRRYKQDVEEGKEAGRERVGMAKRYERYRKEYTSRQLYTLFLTHKDAPWFQERYSTSPAYIAQRRRVNRQGRVPTVDRYIDALGAGEHDDLSFEFPADGTKPGSTSRSQVEPEALDRALGESADEDPLRVEVPPSQRQVFVKTVPPSTGRKELEELFRKVDGFQYLALTEPAVKKSFHRVGWAQFAPGVEVQDVVSKLDNSRVDNFTFHMGVNATPVVGKIRLTVPSANNLDRLLSDGQKAKELAEKLEAELIGDDDEADINGEVKEVEEGGDADVEKAKKEQMVPGLREKGTVFVQEKIEQLLEAAGLTGDLDEEQQRQKAKINLDHWIGYLRHGLSTCFYCVASMAFPEELHRKCISHMRPHPSSTAHNAAADLADRIGEKEDEEEKHEENRAERMEEDEERREDHDRRDEDDKRPGKGKVASHLRTEDEKWAENLDTKLRAVLDSDVDVTLYGGRDIEDETQKLAASSIKQEEPSKYRCKPCSKLFKAPEFVVKHIASKHPEILKSKLDQLTTFNNYVLDPQRLQPGPTILAAVNDELPPMLPAVAPFAGGMPSFNPAFNGNSGMDRAMQQQMMMMMQMQQAMMMAAGGNGMAPASSGGAVPAGGGAKGGASHDAALGPPPGGEDPRAKRGRVSYLDLDEPGGAGDGGLPY